MTERFFAAILALLVTALLAVEARAGTPDRPRLIAAANVEVEGETITLGKIARITSSFAEHEELVAKLKALNLGPAPAPRMSLAIPGARVLEVIRESGIDPDSIGYSIPKSITVSRGGQVVTFDQVLPEVRRTIAQNEKLDLQVREVTWSHGQIVPAGDLSFDVEMLGKPQKGSVPLRIIAYVDDKPAARFLATAIVDDWREVPVLNKTIERGMLISPSDIELIRLNLFKQSPDIAEHSRQVVGRRAKNTLAAGSTIKKSMIDIPPVIPQGARVKMIYSNGLLEASATGMAMEDGFDNSVIKLKNVSTRRIVEGRVMGPETVEVNIK